MRQNSFARNSQSEPHHSLIAAEGLVSDLDRIDSLILRASGNRDEVKLGKRRRHPKHIPYCLRIDVWKTCGHGRYPTLEAIFPASRVLGLRRDALRASTTARVDAHLLFSIVRFTPTGRTRDRSSSSSSSSKSSHRAGHESSGENDASHPSKSQSRAFIEL